MIKHTDNDDSVMIAMILITDIDNDDSDNDSSDNDMSIMMKVIITMTIRGHMTHDACYM